MFSRPLETTMVGNISEVTTKRTKSVITFSVAALTGSGATSVHLKDENRL